MSRSSIARPRGVLAVAAILVAAAGSTAAAAGPRPHVADATEVIIGNIASQSGQYSIVVPADVGLEIAIDEINAAGGIEVGDETYVFTLETLDDRSDPAISAGNARELLQAGARVVFGPGGAGSASVLELTRASQVILVTPSSAAISQIGSGDPQYLLTALPSASDRALSAATTIREFFPDASTMTMIGSDDPTMAAVVDATTAAWEAEGGTVETVLYPPGTSDLSAFIANIASSEPDVLYIGQNTQSVTLALQQLDAAGISDDVVIVGHGTDPALASEAGGRPYIALPFSPGPLTGDGTNDASAALVEQYLAKTGSSELPAYSPPLRYYYDIMHVIAAAMTTAGSVDDTDAILGAILGQDIGYEGAVGPLSFTTEGYIQFPLQSVYVAPDGTATPSLWEPAT